ncbi:MAG: hypothetical protein JW789_00265 [Candidatus Aenigmarchaeota archaeon]|nr:hypothetical protein [Candidatus Aenigmarchaeota archaeon]
MSRLLCVPLMAFLMIALPMQAMGQEIIAVEAEGSCRDFDVTVTAANLTEGCWDVKLDIPGQINTGSESNEDWSSTFYYKDKAICYPETDEVTLQLKLDSRDTTVMGTAKLRFDSRIIEKDFSIQQSCPPPAEPLSGEWSIIVSIVVILIFGWLITWWWKGK